MANTTQGFLEDDKYDSILYVSKSRFETLKKKVKGAKADVSEEELKGLMFPDDLDDDELLIPVDISGEKDFPQECEECFAKYGGKGAVEAIVKAREAFEKSSKTYKKNELPIDLPVGEWMTIVGTDEMLLAEGGVEENGEEEDLSDDEEVEEEEEPPSKKRKKA
eukprot:TRINITY_DN10870_c0_g1_i1.p1 TRINITY_DN10870_c0_g1~~TRINITY_DN10870_c0_g1_i1.p1  ORF type:complete len:164 (-),score=62.12 TRINITY_DN10870_c0_g1_i1:67-558(-)